MIELFRGRFSGGFFGRVFVDKLGRKDFFLKKRGGRGQKKERKKREGIEKKGNKTCLCKYVSMRTTISLAKGFRTLDLEDFRASGSKNRKRVAIREKRRKKNIVVKGGK